MEKTGKIAVTPTFLGGEMKRIMLVISLVLLHTLTFTIAGNAAGIGLREVGVRLALVMPDGPAGNTLGLGMVAQMRKVEFSAQYWRDSTGDMSFKSTELAATVKLRYEAIKEICPFAGGGLAFLMARSKRGGTLSESDDGIAAHFVGGVDTPINPKMKFATEAKYTMGAFDTFQLVGTLFYKL